MNLEEKISLSLNKFDLCLNDIIVLTEAASGNYVVTPIIAAMSGAKVFAFTKNSKYGTVNEVKDQTMKLANLMGVANRIKIITSLDEIDLSEINILTNTGFLRPINGKIIEKLSSGAVIPLMWEPWEFRKEDLDIDACRRKGIKVYGTNESDSRLRTMEYLGFSVLYHLLKKKKSPFSANVLLLADKYFGNAIESILYKNDYNTSWISEYNHQQLQMANFDVIVCAEHSNPIELVGRNGFIKSSEINEDVLIIHISGNVDFTELSCNYLPEKPAPFGYMSYTADYIDSMAIIDLHTAGLKVAEGMLKANKSVMSQLEYKSFMEENYPALAFEEKKYW